MSASITIKNQKITNFDALEKVCTELVLECRRHTDHYRVRGTKAATVVRLPGWRGGLAINEATGEIVVDSDHLHDAESCSAFDNLLSAYNREALSQEALAQGYVLADSQYDEVNQQYVLTFQS